MNSNSFLMLSTSFFTRLNSLVSWTSKEPNVCIAKFTVNSAMSRRLFFIQCLIAVLRNQWVGHDGFVD
ncbi:hypothetical protein Patl1_03816 [Pistacia atlantica]|uniref:Uncharacterized protein n=1 Tax=Pistacia atlantica TaxID=434234 RepID=A0ACC1BVY5_9ROSI|nr:hypothetical protein Patl1_03816 [Pistacia atlantica]